LPNDEAFYRVVARHPQVRYIFSGHIHRTISGVVHGIPFAIFKSPVHQQPMTFDSLDGSLSVDEPGAYGIVFASPASVLVHTEDYDLSSAHACMVGPESLCRHELG
jgi:3',5'-cyclic-AMP phosphodiesterase